MISDNHPPAPVALHREINDLRKKLSRQQHYMDSVHETTMGLIQQLGVNTLLEKILTKAGLLADTPDTFLYLYDAHADELVVKLGQGIYVDLVGARIKPDQGLAGKVYTTGESILVDDYKTWPKRIKHPLYENLHSALGIPLKSNTRPIGVVGLGSFDPAKPFGPEDLKQMARFAELASVALGNARLNDKLQKELIDRKKAEESVRILNAELEQRVMERTAKLKQAFSEIKTLKGILPICSECKKIRNHKGDWKRLEIYIEKKSEASFSHSICPECAKALYPDLDIY
ncbi:GAF domain-containing protein [Desulfocicer vacuolatum DSM 3385]|uniref:GAF domain-containing protein n=1 Tax=Desulfocicer vacuolatum DSM 3385 TaxID=1121400 RepID=A0A1W2B6L4_9BACT|nr:GAF domain-containing protein [Desulfocicer vacuolatum]SMC68576.1 GAF domain-containing protein [Desulfocicer vacuolatum DSM 3385]